MRSSHPLPKYPMVLRGFLVVMLIAPFGCNSGSRSPGPVSPGAPFQVPPLPPDSFTPVDTLSHRNPPQVRPYLSVPRDCHTATTLRNGLVLLVGGTSAGSAVRGTDVYDERSAEFSPTGPLGAARRHHTANLTTSGDVVILGGIGSASTPLASAEIYSAGTGRFNFLQTMRVPRVGHSATVLPSGEVLVVGGVTDAQGSRVTSSAEALNLSTGQWREAAPYLSSDTRPGRPGALHAALPIPGRNGLLGDGDDQVLFLGGVMGDPASGQIIGISGTAAIFTLTESTNPPGMPPVPGSWREVSVGAASGNLARLGPKAFVVSTDAVHPLTGESLTQVFVIGGLRGPIGLALGSFIASTPGVSTIEDSPSAATSWAMLDLWNDTIATMRPRASITQAGCVGDPLGCGPFVGGLGSRATYSSARGMLLYSGGNALGTSSPVARTGHGPFAFVIEMIRDPMTGYRVPLVNLSAGAMGNFRSWHSSALLPGPDKKLGTADDTVLVAGGEQGPNTETGTADEYTFP